MIGHSKVMKEINNGTDLLVNYEVSTVYIELWHRILRSKSHAFSLGYVPHSQSFNADFLKNHRSKLNEFKALFYELLKEVSNIRTKTKEMKKSYIEEIKSYQDIISEIIEFLKDNKSVFNSINKILNKLEDLEPGALTLIYNYPVWPNSAFTERLDSDFFDKYSDDSETLEREITNHFLSLRFRFMYQWNAAFNEIDERRYEMYEEHYSGSNYFDEEVLSLTRHKIIDSLEETWKYLRNAIEQTISWVEEILLNQMLIQDSNFLLWLVNIFRAETAENELFDFKREFSFWNPRLPAHKISAKQIEMIKLISSFANRNGGILIIGVEDSKTHGMRNLYNIGLSEKDIENKLKAFSSEIENQTSTKFIRELIVRQFSVLENGNTYNIIVFLIPATNFWVKMKSLGDTIWHRIVESKTKIESISPTFIKSATGHKNTNYNYLESYYRDYRQ